MNAWELERPASAWMSVYMSLGLAVGVAFGHPDRQLHLAAVQRQAGDPPRGGRHPGQRRQRIRLRGKIGPDRLAWLAEFQLEQKRTDAAAKAANALLALYPKSSEESRWVDGVLARKKGLGL